MQGSISETPEQRIPQSDSLYQPLVGSSYEPAASEDTLSSKPALPPQIQLFNGQVILNPTISRINFVAYLLFSTYLTLIVLPAGLLTLPLLKFVYGLSPKAALTASTISQVVALVVRFIAFPIFGALCDRFGRRTVIIAGVIFLNAGIILTPGLPGVYPWFILISLFQDLGLTCVMVPPLLADYIDYETKGRVAGIAGVMTHLASFISTYITSAISVQDNIPAEYHYIGLAGLVIGVIIILGLKGGAYHKAFLVDKKAEEAKQKVVQMIQEEKRRQSEDHGSVIRNGIGSVHQDSENVPFASQEQNEELQPTVSEREVTGGQKPGFKAGIKEAKRNPWILMGYLANFLNLGIAVIINGTLVNYVPAVTGNQDDANQAYNLANKQVLGSLISIFFFGYAMDKLDKFKILLFSIILSMAGVVLMMIAPSPYNFIAYISMVCFGIAGAGIGTFTNQVLSKYPNPKYRASVSAVGGICSLLGQIWIGLVGTGLSQINASIPFYLYFGGCVVIILAILRIYTKKRDILSKL